MSTLVNISVAYKSAFSATLADDLVVSGASLNVLGVNPTNINIFRPNIVVGSFSSTAPAAGTNQVTTLTPTAVDSTLYAVIIGGVRYTITSGTSSTATTIVTAFKAVINADSACLATATGTSTLILTAKGTTSDLTKAWIFSIAVGANLSIAYTTAGVTRIGFQDSILALYGASVPASTAGYQTYYFEYYDKKDLRDGNTTNTGVPQYYVLLCNTDDTDFATYFQTPFEAYMNASTTLNLRQLTTAIASASFVAGSGTAVKNDSTFGGYTIGQIVTALKAQGLLA